MSCDALPAPNGQVNYVREIIIYYIHRIYSFIKVNFIVLFFVLRQLPHSSWVFSILNYTNTQHHFGLNKIQLYATFQEKISVQQTSLRQSAPQLRHNKGTWYYKWKTWAVTGFCNCIIKLSQFVWYFQRYDFQSELYVSNWLKWNIALLQALTRKPAAVLMLAIAV